jgi:hypothetical protein
MVDFKPQKPDYKSDGVAVWKGTSKNGKEMLTIKVVGQNPMYAFRNDEVEVPKQFPSDAQLQQMKQMVKELNL